MHGLRGANLFRVRGTYEHVHVVVQYAHATVKYIYIYIYMPPRLAASL